jgi:hypothetical protein
MLPICRESRLQSQPRNGSPAYGDRGSSAFDAGLLTIPQRRLSTGTTRTRRIYPGNPGCFAYGSL